MYEALAKSLLQHIKTKPDSGIRRRDRSEIRLEYLVIGHLGERHTDAPLHAVAKHYHSGIGKLGEQKLYSVLAVSVRAYHTLAHYLHGVFLTVEVEDGFLVFVESDLKGVRGAGLVHRHHQFVALALQLQALDGTVHIVLHHAHEKGKKSRVVLSEGVLAENAVPALVEGGTGAQTQPVEQTSTLFQRAHPSAAIEEGGLALVERLDVLAVELIVLQNAAKVLAHYIEGGAGLE